MKLAVLWDMLKHAVTDWWTDNAPRLGASLAFYTLLSLAPILVIVTAVAGSVYGEEAVRGQLVHQMEDLVGKDGAEAVQGLLANAYRAPPGLMASLVGLAVLLFGATGMFVELQDSLNLIWGVPPRQSGGVWALVKGRLLSFVMIVVIGFLLLLSLVASTALTALSGYLDDVAPPLVWRGIEFLISIGVLTILFAMIYKLLPDVQIAWGDVWIGALLTAVLFTLGKFAIGLYLAYSSMASTYGAAGSLVVLLIWVYYSAQIFFLGAELTEVYANRLGSRLIYRQEPTDGSDALQPSASAAGDPGR